MEQLKILVVDDDREIVDSIGIFLKAEGYAVEKAYNGLEALDILMSRTVHLLLLDIMMPEMDGIKTLLKVRESKNIPIILISAKSEDADKILGLTAGADDYITKPFNPSEMVARVKSQLRRYTQLGAMQVTEKQIGDAKTQYISKAKSVAKGDPLFKIITDNKWYVVAYLPNNAVAGWEAGKTSRTLNMMTEEETYKISADVESLTAGDKQTKVVFSSYEHMEDFMESRTISFSLEGTVTEGLKIPNDAIVEKSLLKIPRSCLTESMGNTGVLLVKGSSTKFTDITAVTSDEDAVYIELEDSGLKTGDVVLQGTGEDAAQVTLSELLPHAGVYVANSSIAKFVVIDVVEQNQEYAIVQAGSTTGLQPYDTIVSDAKNIKEGDSVF